MGWKERIDLCKLSCDLYLKTEAHAYVCTHSNNIFFSNLRFCFSREHSDDLTVSQIAFWGQSSSRMPHFDFWDNSGDGEDNSPGCASSTEICVNLLKMEPDGVISRSFENKRRHNPV